MSTGSIFDVFKAQILLNQKDNMFYGLIILTLFEFVTGFLREFFSWAKGYANEYVKKKFTSKIQEVVASTVENVSAELFFERVYNRNDNWDRADAILMHVLKIPAAHTVLVVGQLEIVKNQKEFEIDQDIQFQLLDLQVDQKNGTLERILFKLFSKDLTVCELRGYVEKLAEEYLIMKKNNLGNKTYYFDHIVEKVNPRMSAPRKILFSKHPFNTNRTLDNVFHERQEELKHRVNFFLNRKDWYDKRGIPHTLGLLLYGPPGTGKTSSIKAIANMAHRHIVNINLGAIRTKKQLKKLFYDERLEICENMENTSAVTEYIIPIEKRLYVMEDIDAALESDPLLKKRSRTDPSTITFIEDHAYPSRHETPYNVLPEETGSDLDLATILNILDGSLETPGRALIIGSNLPEKLDEALIRPGRIDMLIEYKKCNRQVLCDMYTSFFDITPDSELLEKIPEYLWTPAEVAQLLFKNFGDPVSALQDLVELDPREYFKFCHVPDPEPSPDLVQEPPQPPPTPEHEPADAATQEFEPDEPREAPEFTYTDPVMPGNLAECANTAASELAEQLQHERKTAVIDMASEADFQYMMGGQMLPALQANTHQDTYTLLSTGYAPSQSGYAFAGL